jgi:hypothetical protein
MERRPSRAEERKEKEAMQAQYRADHVGSFLRPADLLEARRTSTSDPGRVQAIEDCHIARVLSKQQELGFTVFTDGELRRSGLRYGIASACIGGGQGIALLLENPH